jgi:isopentenyldiphosphate isomerase
MIIDYRYFKLLESINGLDKDYIIKYVMNHISLILKNQEHFVVHLCLHSLSLSDLEKHYTFMYKISEMLKTSFPDNLEKCFIYKAPFDNGLTEHELDHVMIGYSNEEPRINSDEVESWKWMSIESIKEDMRANPSVYTVWFRIIFDEFYHYLEDHKI